MNTGMVTGYLPKQAWDAFTPRGQKVVMFDAVVEDDEDGEESTWTCEIRSPGLIARVGDRLLAGKGVLLKYELGGRPFMKNNVASGYVRFLKVVAVQFVRGDQSKLAMGRDEEAEA